MSKSHVQICEDQYVLAFLRWEATPKWWFLVRWWRSKQWEWWLTRMAEEVRKDAYGGIEHE